MAGLAAKAWADGGVSKRRAMALRWLTFLLLKITLEPSSNSTCVALSIHSCDDKLPIQNYSNYQYEHIIIL